MANFKRYPGLAVRVTKTTFSLEGHEYIYTGERLQIVNAGGFCFPFLTFVGKFGTYPIKMAGRYLEPIYGKILL